MINFSMRIRNFETMKGQKPKLLVVSSIEMAQLKLLAIEMGIGFKEDRGDLTEFAGIPVIRASHCLMPEEM